MNDKLTTEQAIEIISDYDVYLCGFCHQGGMEVKEAFDIAIAAMEHSNSNCWIPVTERLPELPDKEYCSVTVIAAVDGCDRAMPMIYERKTSWRNGRREERWKYYWDRICNKKVTHWMPLPEPPKEE